MRYADAIEQYNALTKGNNLKYTLQSPSQLSILEDSYKTIKLYETAKARGLLSIGYDEALKKGLVPELGKSKRSHWLDYVDADKIATDFLKEKDPNFDINKYTYIYDAQQKGYTGTDIVGALNYKPPTTVTPLTTTSTGKATVPGSYLAGIDNSGTKESAPVATATSTNQNATATKTFVPPVNISSNLGPGSTGTDVTALQEWLKTQGFFPKDQAATGYFGDITKNAVAAWQKSIGMAVPAGEEGYFGPKSRAALAAQTVKQTTTPEDTAFFNSEEYTSLTPDQQSAVKSVYDAVSSNDTDTAAQLDAALKKAKEYADPYFKSQISIVTDSLTRGFLEADQDFQYKERSLTQKLQDLRSMTAEEKNALSLDQQAELKKLEDSYAQELDTTRTDMAALGLGQSTKRAQAESILADTKGTLVESSKRRFGLQTSRLDRNLSQSERDTQQEIDRLTEVTKNAKTEMGRKAEQAIGSENLPSLSGYKPMGGITGSIQENYFRDIFNAQNKFIF